MYVCMYKFFEERVSLFQSICHLFRNIADRLTDLFEGFVAKIGRVLFCCGKSLVEKLFGIFVDGFSLFDKRKDLLTVNITAKIFIDHIFPLSEFE